MPPRCFSHTFLASEPRIVAQIEMAGAADLLVLHLARVAVCQSRAWICADPQLGHHPHARLPGLQRFPEAFRHLARRHGRGPQPRYPPQLNRRDERRFSGSAKEQ